MGKQYIHSLTPLRGIAALLVLVYHYHIFIAPITTPGHDALITRWYIMVDFFFILSGFIITHVYQKKFETGFQWPVFKKFMLARFARLYPLHILTLIFMVLIYLLFKTTGTFDSLSPYSKVAFNLEAISHNILLTQSLGFLSEPTWNTPSWSISAEWWTYLLFPLLVLIFNPKKQWIKWAALIVVILGYLSIMFYFQPQQYQLRALDFEGISTLPNTIDVMVGSSLLRCICGFILGVLVYHAYSARTALQLVSRSSFFVIITLITLLGWHFSLLPDLVSVLLFALIILSASYNDGKIKQILNRRSLQFLGEISYSVYMIHFPLIFGYYFLRNFFPISNSENITSAAIDVIPEMVGTAPVSLWLSYLGLIVFIGTTVFIAFLTYQYFEKPMRNIIKSKRSVQPKKESTPSTVSSFEMENVDA